MNISMLHGYLCSTCWLLDVNRLLATKVIKYDFVAKCFMLTCHLLLVITSIRGAT